MSYDYVRSKIAEAMGVAAETTPLKVPVTERQMELLRRYSDQTDEELQRRYVEIGTLPTINTLEPIHLPPKEPLPPNPGPASKWGERRAHLERKKK